MKKISLGLLGIMSTAVPLVATVSMYVPPKKENKRPDNKLFGHMQTQKVTLADTDKMKGYLIQPFDIKINILPKGWKNISFDIRAKITNSAEALTKHVWFDNKTKGITLFSKAETHDGQKIDVSFLDAKLVMRSSGFYLVGQVKFNEHISWGVGSALEAFVTYEIN